MKVWLLYIYVSTGSMSPVLVDNIANEQECHRVMMVMSRAVPARGICIEVWKVKQ